VGVEREPSVGRIRAVTDERDLTQAYDAAAGCGKFSRDALELAAIHRVDSEAPVPDGVLDHVPGCFICRAVVDRLHADNQFLGEVREAVRDIAKPRREEQRREEPSDGGGPIPGYRLGAELQRGGQGAVFVAEQIATRRACAVKMLLSGRFASERQRQRFEREIEVVARLRHPSIVTLYESGLSRDGEPWFAMEFIEGERLDAFVATRKPAPREVLRYFRQIADGVAYAHRRGVIHRDLKPGNILVDREGVPRILDFGLARSTERTVADDVGTTLAGEFLGTFAYAAPEQLAGDPNAIDSRCDLYALGVVLYECLTGRKPFEGARSVAELVAQKTAGTPARPSELVRGVNRDIDVIVLRLLAADPARRYVSADALAEDIDRFLDGRPILAREDSIAYVVRKTLVRYWVASSAALALLVTVVVAGIALLIAYSNAERERLRSERTLRSFQEALVAANPELGKGSGDMSVGGFLSLVEGEVEEALSDEPVLLADVLQTIGVVHLGFDNPVLAQQSILRAYAMQKLAFDRGETTDARMGAAALAMARLRFLLRPADGSPPDYAGSEAAYREAIAHFERAYGPDSLAATDTLRQLASPVRAQGRLDEAEACLADAFARAERIAPESRQLAVLRAAILNSRAIIATVRGDSASALEGYRGALEQLRPYTEPDDFRVGRTLVSIARSLQALGRPEEALPSAREAVEILRTRKGANAESTRAAEKLVEDLERAIRGEPEPRAAPAADPSKPVTTSAVAED
jgi:tRNA A-37 threonylcarbamoyl transferase component Bud32/tetratricopeptide (TPR) repeat protein